MRMLLIANISIEPFWRANVQGHCATFSNNMQTEFISYEEHRGKMDSIRSASVIVICLNFEALYTNIINDVLSGSISYNDVIKDCMNKCSELYSCIKRQTGAHIIWFGFEDYYSMQSWNCGAVPVFNGIVDKLNLYLNRLLIEDTFIDLKRLIAEVGIKNAYDKKGKYRWNAPYTPKVVDIMRDEVYKYKQQYI